MQNFIRSCWGKLISYFLIFGLVYPLLSNFIWITPGYAQEAEKIALPAEKPKVERPKQGVAVLEFVNKTGIGNSLLGREAADAVALRLGETNWFEVVPKAQVEEQLQLMNLTPPLDKTQQALLGKALKVPLVVSGTVLSCEAEKNHRAEVALEILMLEVTTAEYCNGATVTGASTPKPGYRADMDRLVTEALSNAAFNGVQRMLSQKLPQGIVSTVMAGEVHLSVGQKHGVTEGMEMVVTREKYYPAQKEKIVERIGKIRVFSTSPTDSIARIISNEGGITSEDKVKAIYQPPAPPPVRLARVPEARRAPATAAAAPRRGGQAQWLQTLMGILLILGLVELAKPGAPTVAAAPAGVVAAAASEGSAVRVSWNRPSTPPVSDIVAYLIYRSTVPYFSPNPIPSWGTSGGGITGNPDEPQGNLIDVIADGAATVYYDDANDVPHSVTLTVTVPANLVGVTGTQTQQQTIDIDYLHPGLVNGTTYYYKVVRLVREVVGGGVGVIGQQQQQFQLRVVPSRVSESPGGPVTPLALPKLDYPKQFPGPGSTNVDIGKAVFRWYSVAGADEYIVEVSDNLNFSGGRTWRSAPYYSPTLQPNILLGGDRTNDLTGVFPRPAGGATLTLYWRVGARNSRDAQRPYPAGYVFSRANMFQTGEMPPSPP